MILHELIDGSLPLSYNCTEAEACDWLRNLQSAPTFQRKGVDDTCRRFLASCLELRMEKRWATDALLLVSMYKLLSGVVF